MTTAAELAELIRDDIAAALRQPDITLRMAMLRAAAGGIFRIAYDEEPGDPKGVDQAAVEFLNQINGAMGQTIPDGTDEQVDRITEVWATAAANAARYYSDPKATKTWKTMRDDRVRDHHRVMEGVTVAAGQTFEVAGHKLHYPGEPVGPPEVWINCRCRLDLGMTAGGEPVDELDLDELEVNIPFFADNYQTYDGGQWRTENNATANTAATIEVLSAASDKPWSQFSAADYTISQWRRACLMRMPGGDPDSKSTYKLPVREPGGALNRNGVHAAAAALAGARGGVNGPKAAARAKLRGLYKQLGEDPPDSLAADAATPETVGDVLLAWPKSTSPPGTHDGPGWLTNPVDTQRLRRYWERGPGAAKIGWGSPGDLTRCHRYLSKYIAPEFVWGTCQNMHKETLGIWNPESRHGRRGAADELAAAGITDTTPPEMQALIDAAFAEPLEDNPMLLPPSDWFADPGFDGPTPLTITSDGRVLGHLATWGTCHVGFEGKCVEPPHSANNYASFRTGEVETADGQRVPVGQITMETGHAGKGDSPLAAASHYDNTGTGVADVAAGEDAYGIWVAGAMRPGVSEQQMYVLKATGALSGDWRRIGGNLELVAALVVNVPGFPIPRVQLAASGEMELSLVAAGIVQIDPNAMDPETVAIAVIARLDQREADKARRARAEALLAEVTTLRVDALAAAVR